MNELAMLAANSIEMPFLASPPLLEPLTDSGFFNLIEWNKQDRSDSRPLDAGSRFAPSSPAIADALIQAILKRSAANPPDHPLIHRTQQASAAPSRSQSPSPPEPFLRADLNPGVSYLNLYPTLPQLKPTAMPAAIGALSDASQTTDTAAEIPGIANTPEAISATKLAASSIPAEFTTKAATGFQLDSAMPRAHLNVASFQRRATPSMIVKRNGSQMAKTPPSEVNRIRESAAELTSTRVSRTSVVPGNGAVHIESLSPPAPADPLASLDLSHPMDHEPSTIDSQMHGAINDDQPRAGGPDIQKVLIAAEKPDNPVLPRKIAFSARVMPIDLTTPLATDPAQPLANEMTAEPAESTSIQHVAERPYVFIDSPEESNVLRNMATRPRTGTSNQELAASSTPAGSSPTTTGHSSDAVVEPSADIDSARCTPRITATQPLTAFAGQSLMPRSDQPVATLNELTSGGSFQGDQSPTNEVIAKPASRTKSSQPTETMQAHEASRIDAAPHLIAAAGISEPGDAPRLIPRIIPGIIPGAIHDALALASTRQDPNSVVVASTPKSQAAPLNMAEILRVSEPTALAAPLSPSNPIERIELHLAHPNMLPVGLQVIERSGEIRVSVHTADTALQTSLRQELSTLASSLEHVGYHAEFISQESGARPAFPPAMPPRDARQQESGRGGPGNFSQGRHQHAPRDQRNRVWLEELENSK